MGIIEGERLQMRNIRNGGYASSKIGESTFRAAGKTTGFSLLCLMKKRNRLVKLPFFFSGGPGTEPRLNGDGSIAGLCGIGGSAIITDSLSVS